jgi:DNA (cytosine-5)-methyltransferase 1
MRDRSILQSSAHETLAARPESRRHTVFVGGFPCQDISVAGKGAGLDASHSGLWREMLRLISECRPGWVVLENVSIIRARGLDKVLRQLDALGYVSQWHCIPAQAVGAPHVRDRVWIISHSDKIDGQAGIRLWQDLEETLQSARDRFGSTIWLESDRPAPRVADGISRGVDEVRRIEAIGNAIVPQIAEIIAGGIKKVTSDL